MATPASDLVEISGNSDQSGLSESYFRVLTAQKLQLEEALRTQEHAKTVYETTAAELSRNFSELSLSETENVVRAKKLQALKDKLHREQLAREEKQRSTVNLEKRVLLQEELIMQMEMLLASHKLGDTVLRSSGSTAATTLLSSNWKAFSDTPEQQRLRELEVKLERLEEESARQSELTQRLCSELASFKQLSPRRPKSKVKATKKKRKAQTKSPKRPSEQRICSARVRY